MASNDDDAVAFSQLTEPPDEPIDLQDDDDDEDDGKVIDSIWDCPKMILKPDPESGKVRWHCGWCGYTGGGRNATKALAHVMCIHGENVKICDGRKISDSARKKYSVLYNRLKRKNQGNVFVRQEQLNTMLNQSQELAAHNRDVKRAKLSSTNDSTASSISSNSHMVVSATSSMGSSSKKLKQAPLNSFTNPLSGKKLTLQTTLTGVCKESRDLCTAAIADMIHSLGLPFSLASEPKFRHVIRMAKHVDKDYKPPSRQQLAGELLDNNYNVYMSRTKELLLKEAWEYGLVIYGDGATVKRLALFNILAAGAHVTNAVLEIKDTFKHMSSGGIKDAEYIAEIVRKHMEDLDPMKCLFDVVYFDGASNVQKAGAILEIQYPKVTCLHAIEHVVSLFFADIAKQDQIHQLIDFCRHAYRVFGSGSRHTVFAIYKHFSLLFFQGRYIGCVRAADSRMAGFFIAMQRLLRVRKVLEATVTHPGYPDDSKKVSRGNELHCLKTLIQNPTIWDTLYVVVRAVLPALRVLRLADSKRPGMDRAWYYLRKTEACLLKSKEDLDKALNYSKLGTTSGYQRSTIGKVFYNLRHRFELDGSDSSEEDDDFQEDTEAKTGETTENKTKTEREDEGIVSDRYSDDGFHNRSEEDVVPLEPEEEKSCTPGAIIISRWSKRMQQCKSLWTIAGWYMSPDKTIQEDVRIHGDGMCQLDVEKLLRQLFEKDPQFYSDPRFKGRENDFGSILLEFWEQWHNFNTRSGPLFGREHIWQSELISNGQTHIWHAMFSQPHSPILGLFGKRVCSKILGIGSAERSWKDVKHLKKDKRSHLSAAKVEKQATIFGIACMERAENKRKRSLFVGPSEKDKDLPIIWDEEDFDEMMESFGYQKASEPKVYVREFNCWFEDWEREIAQDKSHLNELRFLQKYGGLSWKDPDSGNKVFTADTKYMCWQDKRKKKEIPGYCVYGIREDYDPTKGDDNPVNKDKWEPWDIQGESPPIYYLIEEYYKENPCKTVKINVKPNEDNLEV